MALEGEEPWDDTVLIKAFDRAISTFKVIHGKEGQKISSMGGEVIISREERNSAGLVSESNEVKRDLETNVNNVASRTETEETTNPSLDKGSLVDDNGTGHNMSSSNGQTSHNTYSNTEATEDYNLLLSQYYQVEEQRQKILHQLYQYGSWNYGDYNSSIQWGTNSASYGQEVPTQASRPTDSIAIMDGTSASQGHQVLPTQACCSAVACCCCSCMCPGLVGPDTSLPACTLSGTCVGKFGHNTSAAGQNGKSSPVVEDDLVKTAMGAADRALSALRTKVSGDANISEDKVTKLETDVGKLAQNCSSKTDLTVVFNAWYSAGFYTCKYLMEQSAANK